MEKAMKLSEKAEEILEAMWTAIEENGDGFAEAGKIGVAADDPALDELTKFALIEIKEGRITFRPEGRKEGSRTIRRHRLAERLIMDVINIRGENGNSKACEVEHLLNEGMDAKVCTMLNHPDTCPHGKAIPAGDCCLEAKQSGDLGVVPLTELKSGEEGRIAYIQTEDNKKMQKLVAMGVLPGNSIRLMQSFPSYIFRVGYSEFAVDAEMAREIFISRRPDKG
jgi:DtxR family transcriptional regulator, Mn-dependent transcriptional regulator